MRERGKEAPKRTRRERKKDTRKNKRRKEIPKIAIVIREKKEVTDKTRQKKKGVTERKKMYMRENKGGNRKSNCT